MFSVEDIISNYWRGYTDDQLERARFMALLMILVKKGVLTSDDAKEAIESVEGFLKEIIEADKKGE